MTTGSIPRRHTATPKVVPLRQGRDATTAPMLAQVQRHWAALRHGAPLPARADLRPDALGPALPCAFLVDRPRPGKLRFRLAGQNVCRLMGMDVRGMPLRAFFEIPDRKRLLEQAEGVFAGPATLMLRLISDAPGCAMLEAQMLLLPLRGRSGVVDCALGVMATDGPIGLPPRRFRIGHAALSPLDQAGTARAPDGTGETIRGTRFFGRRSLTVIAGGKR